MLRDNCELNISTVRQLNALVPVIILEEIAHPACSRRQAHHLLICLFPTISFIDACGIADIAETRGYDVYENWEDTGVDYGIIYAEFDPVWLSNDAPF